MGSCCDGSVKFASVDVSSPPLYTLVFEVVYWAMVFVGIGFLLLGFTQGWMILFLLGVFGIGLLVYGGWIEPRWVQVSRHEMSLTTQPQTKIRIVFVSDLHIGGHKSPAFYERMARCIERQHPDLLLFGGDYVDSASSAIQGLSCFSSITCPLGKYFILGNHDFDDDPTVIRQALRSFGFDDLTNQRRCLEKDGRACVLIGLDDAWFGDPKPSLMTANEEVPKILLTHEPDLLFDLPEGAADLVFLGHTHGGQVCWPFFGPVTPLSQAAPQFLDQGRRIWRGMPILISRGLGESSSRVRFLARPEIMLVDVGF